MRHAENVVEDAPQVVVVVQPDVRAQKVLHVLLLLGHTLTSIKAINVVRRGNGIRAAGGAFERTHSLVWALVEPRQESHANFRF